jgi:hypothetical protein
MGDEKTVRRRNEFRLLLGVLRRLSEAGKRDLAPPGQFPLKSSAKIRIKIGRA